MIISSERVAKVLPLTSNRKAGHRRLAWPALLRGDSKKRRLPRNVILNDLKRFFLEVVDDLPALSFTAKRKVMTLTSTCIRLSWIKPPVWA